MKEEAQGDPPLPRARLIGGDKPHGTIMPAVGHAGRHALSARPT